jgi:hypothetical protein
VFRIKFRYAEKNHGVPMKTEGEREAEARNAPDR